MKVQTFQIEDNKIIAGILDGDMDFTYGIDRADFEEFIKNDTMGYSFEDYYTASREINDTPLRENLRLFINSNEGERLKYAKEKAYAKFLDLCFQIEDDDLRNQILETERDVRVAIYNRHKYLAA